MNYRHYDIVIVGAGPAGLSAARTAARLGFRTLVLERLGGPGELAHPCAAAISPIPGFVSGLRRPDGSLYFPAVDLLIALGMVAGAPRVQRFISPGRSEFQVTFAARDDFPLAVVDKPALLRQMAGQAAGAGAELCYATPVAHLLREHSRVSGVVTAAGQAIRAYVVMSAEGTPGVLAEEAGLYARSTATRQVAHVLHKALAAPGVTPDNVGQIVTLGRRHTTAAQALGMIVMPAPGQAGVFFHVYEDCASAHQADELWPYFDEYVQGDPRVRGLLAHARVLDQATATLAIHEAPRQVVRDGFMGIGDAVTPAGPAGILPAIYMGRQAALIAAEAIEAGSADAECLATYQQLWQAPVLRGLEAGGRTLLNLTRMADDDLDRLCQALNKLNLGTPFFGNWRTVAWQTLGWLARQFPLLARDGDVLQQALGMPLLPAANPRAGSLGDWPMTAPAGAPGSMAPGLPGAAGARPGAWLTAHGE